jgi:hypothetical protein
MSKSKNMFFTVTKIMIFPSMKVIRLLKMNLRKSEDRWQGTNPHGNVGLFPGKSLVFLFGMEIDAYGFFF